MQTFDIVLIILIGSLSILQGLRHGFISQCVTIVSLFVGLWMVRLFGPTLNGWMEPVLNLPAAAVKTLSFCIIFLATFIAIMLAGKVLLKIVSLTFGKWIDYVLGILLAAVKICALLCVVIYLFDELNSTWLLVDQNVLDSSYLYNLSHTVRDFVWQK